MILKAGRQKRICDKIKECLYNQFPQFLSLGSEIRLAQAMDTALFLFLSLSQSDNANVKFNIYSQMKISLEYHQRGLSSVVCFHLEYTLVKNSGAMRRLGIRPAQL